MPFPGIICLKCGYPIADGLNEFLAIGRNF
jgi:hypothetical protein